MLLLQFPLLLSAIFIASQWDIIQDFITMSSICWDLLPVLIHGQSVNIFMGHWEVCIFSSAWVQYSMWSILLVRLFTEVSFHWWFNFLQHFSLVFFSNCIMLLNCVFMTWITPLFHSFLWFVCFALLCICFVLFFTVFVSVFSCLSTLIITLLNSLSGISSRQHVWD